MPGALTSPSMPVRLEVTADAGIVVVRDPAVPLPAETHLDALMRRLEELARAGQVFFLSTDDPVRYRIDLYVGESPPASVDRDFEPLGGSFLLEAPTGRLVVEGCDLPPRSEGGPGTTPIEVPAGRHVLTARGRRPFDGKRHSEDMAEGLGPAEWRSMTRVDRLGLLGCLPTVVTLLLAITGRWRWLALYGVPLLVVSWLPYLILKNTRRYRLAERRMHEHESARPQFILTLIPTAQEGLSGGFLRV
jgi:hypothetical protein